MSIFQPLQVAGRGSETQLQVGERLYAYGIVGKARSAHLSTSHHIKPEPLGERLMW